MDDTIEQIWQSYHAGLRGFIRSRVGDDSAADDILQEVFLRIHARIGSLEDSGKINIRPRCKSGCIQQRSNKDDFLGSILLF